jgi:hypothetical protein
VADARRLVIVVRMSDHFLSVHLGKVTFPGNKNTQNVVKGVLGSSEPVQFVYFENGAMMF